MTTLHLQWPHWIALAGVVALIAVNAFALGRRFGRRLPPAEALTADLHLPRLSGRVRTVHNVRWWVYCGLYDQRDVWSHPLPLCPECNRVLRGHSPDPDYLEYHCKPDCRFQMTVDPALLRRLPRPHSSLARAFERHVADAMERETTRHCLTKRFVPVDELDAP